VTRTVPPWAATISATMARPRPLPPASRARASSSRTNRSKTRSPLIPLAVLGGEHQDRGPVLLRAQRRADPIAVEARQHQVQHDRVVLVLAGQPQTIDAVAGQIDREALRLQPDPQGPAESLLVLDDEYAHEFLQTIRTRHPRVPRLNVR